MSHALFPDLGALDLLGWHRNWEAAATDCREVVFLFAVQESTYAGGFNRSLQHLLILRDEEVCAWRGMSASEPNSDIAEPNNGAQFGNYCQ